MVFVEIQNFTIPTYILSPNSKFSSWVSDLLIDSKSGCFFPPFSFQLKMKFSITEMGSKHFKTVHTKGYSSVQLLYFFIAFCEKQWVYFIFSPVISSHQGMSVFIANCPFFLCTAFFLVLPSSSFSLSLITIWVY